MCWEKGGCEARDDEESGVEGGDKAMRGREGAVELKKTERAREVTGMGLRVMNYGLWSGRSGRTRDCRRRCDCKHEGGGCEDVRKCSWVARRQEAGHRAGARKVN